MRKYERGRDWGVYYKITIQKKTSLFGGRNMICIRHAPDAYSGHMLQRAGELLKALLLVWHAAHADQLLSHFLYSCFCTIPEK